MKVWSVFLMMLLVMLSGAGVNWAQEYHWFKGNTHAHTTNSDGNELPRRVVRWYQDYGYNFLILSDHNQITDITYLDSDKNDDFILIPGEEVTDFFERKPVHMVAIMPKAYVAPQHGESVAEVLRNNVQAVCEAGGLAQINHPLWKWVMTADDILTAKGATLIEIYNVNRHDNNFAAGGQPGCEALWDTLLSRGLCLFGVASDDSHDYLGDFTTDKAHPGKGWLMVRARELSAAAIVNSLKQGDFYATVGVLLDDIQVSATAMTIMIRAEGDLAFTTRFIGQDGRVLQEVFGTRAEYRFRGDELYVRAKVLSSAGEFALSQPVFPKNK